MIGATFGKAVGNIFLGNLDLLPSRNYGCARRSPIRRGLTFGSRFFFIFRKIGNLSTSLFGGLNIADHATAAGANDWKKSHQRTSAGQPQNPTTTHLTRHRPLNPRQPLIQIRDQVLDALQADGEADDVGAGAGGD